MCQIQIDIPKAFAGRFFSFKLQLYLNIVPKLIFLGTIVPKKIVLNILFTKF